MRDFADEPGGAAFDGGSSGGRWARDAAPAPEPGPPAASDPVPDRARRTDGPASGPMSGRGPGSGAGAGEASTTRPEDDIRPEPVRGLPERLPPGERILWQGRPSSLQLARDALNTRWVLGWFALLGTWRAGATLADGTLAEAGRTMALYLATGGLAVAILTACAAVMARATCYTITNRRVSLRIGAALTVHAQIPFSRLGSADLALNRNGTGTIAIEPVGASPLSYAVLWPHCRPWHARDPKPALRSISEAERVAELLADAATGAPVAPVRTAREPAPAHAVPAE